MTLSYLTGRRNVHDSPWTAERVELLTVLWGQGYSASQIAKEIRNIHISRSAIIGKVHRLKLPPRQPRKRDIRPAGERKPRVRIWKPQPKPKPLPPASTDDPRMRELTLLQLKPTSCRWPIGDGSPWLFCGATADGSYCPFHQRMARVREKAR